MSIKNFVYVQFGLLRIIFTNALFWNRGGSADDQQKKLGPAENDQDPTTHNRNGRQVISSQITKESSTRPAL